VNKLRSVKEIAENRWELAKHLSKQTQLYLVAGGEIDQQTKKELFRFFRGRNAIDYWDMWERVIAFLVITGNSDAVDEFSESVKAEVKKISFFKSPDSNFSSDRTATESPVNISAKLRVALAAHLGVSLELSRAVRDTRSSNNSAAGQWRSSNLIRHHLVAVPLLNYTNFGGDFAVPGDVTEVKRDQRKTELSPRFVHFDECLGFVDSGFLATTDDDSITAANRIYAEFHGAALEDVKSEIVGRKSRKAK
jgi:hypothetical protein